MKFLILLLIAALTVPATGALAAIRIPLPPASAKVDWASPRAPPTDAAASTPIDLVYSGGPVLISPKVFVTYWDWTNGGGDPDHAAPYLESYLQGVGGSGWANIQTQYDATGRGFIQNPTSQFGGSWHDDASLSPPINGYVTSEVLRAEAHFGYALDAVYFILLPFADVADFSGGWCGYHTALLDGQHRQIAYAVMPYVSNFPDARVNGVITAGCGVNFVNTGAQGKLDAWSIVSGHEYAEAVTDKAPNSGWSASNGENGDKCQFVFTGPARYQSLHLSTGDFAVQSLWSNAIHGCAMTYP